MARRSGSWLAIPLIAVVVITIFVVMRESQPKALSEIERIRRAMQDGRARKYRVRLTLSSALGDQQLRGTLILRGRKEFVLSWNIPLLGAVQVGSDGRQSWGIPPTGPVFASADADQFDAWLKQLPGKLSPEVLHFDSMLKKLTDNYDVELGAADPKGLRLMTAAKRPGAAEWLPPQVEVEYDSESGVVQRLTMVWPGKSTLPRLSRIDFEYSQEVSPPSGYFEHAAHHDADRPVVRLPEGKLPSRE